MFAAFEEIQPQPQPTAMRLYPSSFAAAAAGLLIALLPVFSRAQVAPDSILTKPAVEDPVSLSPFQVVSDRDLGYAASTAMSATRTNEKLENLPNAISVLNQDFLQDIAANNFFDAVDFAVGAENIEGDTGMRGIQGGSRLGYQISFRGLTTFQQLRDGFAWYVPQDMFNTERIEVSRGPGGLAYGDVDTGGILNISSKRAFDRNVSSAQIRYDDFGTRRFSIDLNRQIVPKRLAFRLNAIERNDARSPRQRTNTNGDGLAGAVRWDVTKDGRTSINVTYEHGRQDLFYGHLILNDQTAAYVRGTGTIALDADPVRAAVQTNGVGMQQIAIAPTGLKRFVEIGGTLYNLKSTAAEVYRLSIVPTGANVAGGTDPQNPQRLPVLPAAPSMLPRGQDWGGSDAKVTSDWSAGVVELQHTFTSNLRVALTHNRQRDIADYVSTINYAGLSFMDAANARAVFIDVNPRLPNPTGPGTIPNPRFEEYFVGFSPTKGRDGHRVEGWRGTAVYDAKLPWGITQRFVAGVNYRHEDYERDAFRLALTQEEISRRGFTAAGRSYGFNLVFPIHYLRDGNSDEALRVRTQPGVTGWYRANANQRFDQSLTSGSFTALGGYFKDRLRTSLGISRDHWIQSAALPTRPDPVTSEMRFVDAAGNFVEANRVPLYPFTSSWVTNHTYGGVFKVTSWLALTGTYQESALFNAVLSDNAANPGDLFGTPLKPRRGQGKDFGVRFNLLEDRLHTSFTYYDNTNKNVPLTFPVSVTTELQALLGPVFVGNTDTKDEAARGLELEVVSNLTPNWTSRVGISRTLVHPSNTFPQLKGLLGLAQAEAKRRGLDPDAATAVTSEFVEDADADAGAPGMVRISTKRWVGNVVTRYSFTEGTLRGLALGSSVRYFDGKPRAAAVVGGVTVLPETFTEHQWTVNPFVSYSREVARIRWTVQVNVNNAFERVTDQGTQYRYPRYTEPRRIISTLTARF
jgi:outer membrane receptor protein involved in Fe transport